MSDPIVAAARAGISGMWRDEFLQECVESFDGGEPGGVEPGDVETGDVETVDLATVGCYLSTADGDGRISIFRPTDTRLVNQLVTTAAHEFLHAAYARLGSAETAPLNELLEQRWSQVPADDPIQASLVSSVGSTSENRATEQFAYLGTTVTDAFDPELDAYYARYFDDRSTVVTAFVADQLVWQTLNTQYQTTATALQSRDQANANEIAQLAADRSQLDADFASYTQQIASFNARPSEERARLFVVEDDGSVGELYGEYLDGFADTFVSREADLASRQSLLDASQAEAELERATVELSRVDLENLAAAAVPTAG